MPVDAIYHKCECGFKGWVPYTIVKEGILPICKRLCPNCGKEIKEDEVTREKKKWVCI